MGQNLAIQGALAATGGVGFLQLDADGNLKVVSTAPGNIPSGATPVFSASADVAAASAVATLAAAAGKTTYISGLLITGMGATAAGVALATLVGLLGGTATIVVGVPAGATVGIQPITVNFSTPLPASAVNTAIVLTLPSLGTGNLHAAVSAWGYQL